MRYELVREIPNCCRNNQMRDVFFEEVECDDPEAYVRSTVKGEIQSITKETLPDGSLRIHVESVGLFQKFTFTPTD